MNDDGVWARQPGVLWRQVGDEVIVRRAHRRDVDAESRLTGPAAVIWVELGAPGTGAELAAVLAHAGAEDPDGALRSALALLGDAGLIGRPAT